MLLCVAVGNKSTMKHSLLLCWSLLLVSALLLPLGRDLIQLFLLLL